MDNSKKKVKNIVNLDGDEGKMSFREQILNLFYQSPNYEKVLERFALAIEDDLREYYEIELKKEKESEVLEDNK